ncbi:MAG TPA: hypothetical protein VIV57_06905 [Anaeromyxobacter sp.]
MAAEQADAVGVGFRLGGSGYPMSRAFPYVDFETRATLNGVELREHGEGRPLLFVPGMTGGGQATLDLAVRVAERAAAEGKPHRLFLVDYTAESHDTLEALQDTVTELVVRRLGKEPCLVWTESLGNLVVPPPRLDRVLQVARRVMISPFARVPGLRLAIGLALMAVTPPTLYRWSMAPLGRFMFGPPGDRPDHVFFAAIAEVSPQAARRRSAWLRGKEFAAWFEATSVPTKAWLGGCDRVVSIDEEKERFARLATERRNFRLSVIDGGGHVVTDSRLHERLFGEIYEWVTS